MIQTLTLENYRGFRHFELHDLGRVNLIVGTNNAGKTSILEAISILQSPSDFGAIWSTLSRRGEDVEDIELNRVVRQVDIRRLFNGYELIGESKIRICAKTDAGSNEFRALIARSESESIYTTTPPPSGAYYGSLDPEVMVQPSALGLSWKFPGDGAEVNTTVELTRRGALSWDMMMRGSRSFTGPVVPVRFITAASLMPDAVVELFGQVVLTPDEDFLIEALRVIEPSIERIATSGTERRVGLSNRVGDRGGILVRCAGVRDRIPIGSMGDGIWRILGLALSLARTAGGILLIDEIDTGLHYSVMERMWKLIYETAKKHNIQIFATTHSRDCVDSLAAVCRDDISENSEVTIQRLERAATRSVAYTEQEIVAVADRGVEVR